MREKFTTYFELRDACSQRGCPVCRVLEAKLQYYLDSVFYENVNDAGIRQGIRASLGYCRIHAHRATEIGDALGVAIIYQDILDIIIEGLARESVPLSATECPACAHQRRFEKSYVDTLAVYCDDEELRQAFKESDGLCLPHLNALLVHLGKRGLPEWIVSLQLQKLKQRRSNLSEFLRKQDIHAQHKQLTEPETTACEDAITFLVGMIA